MRDLSARLRAIVRANPPAAPVSGRELTYVPDGLEHVRGLDEVAAELGGRVERSGDCNSAAADLRARAIATPPGKLRCLD